MKISITKIILFVAFFAFSSQTFGLTKNEYLNGVINAPVLEKDLRKSVTTKKKRSRDAAIRAVKSLKREINDAAAAFNISPIHIAGVIIGEHALNVDWKDGFQDANIRRRMLSEWVNQSSDQELFNEIKKSKYSRCNSLKKNYNLWYCLVNTWYKAKYGGITRALVAQNGAYKAFTNHFFNPDGIGKTFGLGQLSPLRALMVNDVVSRTNRKIGNIKFRSTGNSTQAYSDILDPKKVVFYIAATIKIGVDSYRQVARFDISNNPGVVATLYNNGNEYYFAEKRKNKNLNNIRNGKSIEYPAANEMGRWVAQNQSIIIDALR